MTRLMLALAVVTLVSACGIKGDLARPDPMWNHDEAIRRECAQQARDNRPQDARCGRYQSGADAQTPAPTTPHQ